MANYDGSITLATKVDTTGIKTDVKKLANQYEAATQAVERQTKKVEEYRRRLAELENGTTVVNDKGVAKLQSEFDKATVSVKKTEDEIAALYERLDILQSNAFTAPDTGEIMLTGKEQTEFDALTAKLDMLEPKLESNKQKAAELGDNLRKAAGKATQKEIGNTREKLEAAETKLGGLKIKAEEAGNKLKTKMSTASQAASLVSAGFGKMANRLVSLAKSVFVFTVITKALSSVKTVLTDIIMSDDKVKNSLKTLKAAFWTAFAPIYDFIIPAIRSFMDYLAQAMVMVGKFISKLTGKSYTSMIDRGQSLNKQVSENKGGKSDEEKNIENQIKALEKQNKALNKQKKLKQKAQQEEEKANKRSLASFDEINTLSFDKDNEEVDALDDEIEKNDEIIDQLQEQLELIQQQQEEKRNTDADFDGLEKMDISPISETMIELMKLAGASLVAIGLILMFTGHIGWGIGFILIGAAMFGVALQAEQETNPTKTLRAQLAEFGSYLGEALAILGVILIFFGQIPLGIGCIVAGIALFGVSEAILQENGITTKIQTFLKENATLIVGVSTALLILGIILLFTPASLPLALGLIAAGAVGLATEAVLNWDYIKNTMENFFTEHAAWIVTVSGMLLILGIILIVTAVNLPLGIAMVIGGIAGIVTEAVLNWDYIKNTMEKLFVEYKEVIIGMSAALLVLGIILVMTGVGVPIGIGMIVAGLTGLITEAVLNWGYIKDTMEKIFTEHKELITAMSAALLVLGIILLFTGVGIPLGIALIAAGAAGLITEAVLNWDFLSDKVTEICGKVSEIFHKCIDGIKQAWEALPEGIRSALSTLASIITAPFTAAFNAIKSIVSKISELMSSITESSTHVSSSGETHGGTGGSYSAYSMPDLSFEVPALATGAVIPPNREFLAVLGDQKSGTNIEAPLDTIKQAVAEVVGNGTDNINIKFTGSLSQLARVLQPQIKRESRRVGTTLISE